MFDIGFAELFVLLIISLLVLGPEKLPGAVRKVGLMIGKIKGSWQHIQQEIDIELKAEELRKKIDEEASTAQNVLSSTFDADAHNAKIMEQERLLREEIAREQKKFEAEQAQEAAQQDIKPLPSNQESAEKSATDSTSNQSQ